MEILYLISGIIFCELITYSSKYTFALNQKYLRSFPPNFLMQIYFGICALILMALFEYTLVIKISLMDLLKISCQSFLLFSISALIVNTIINCIRKKNENDNLDDSSQNNNFIDENVNKKIFIFMVLFINPITEELLYRCFLLNHILSLDYIIINSKVIIISLPILISGLYFGIVHRSLLKMGMDKYFVYKIVVKATIVGIACGYFYIEYNSITAAIVAHFIANISENLSSSFFNSIFHLFDKKS